MPRRPDGSLRRRSRGRGLRFGRRSLLRPRPEVLPRAERGVSGRALPGTVNTGRHSTLIPILC